MLAKQFDKSFYLTFFKVKKLQYYKHSNLAKLQSQRGKGYCSISSSKI